MRRRDLPPFVQSADEEKLELERLFAAMIALPRRVQIRQNLPKFCSTFGMTEPLLDLALVGLMLPAGKPL